MEAISSFFSSRSKKTSELFKFLEELSGLVLQFRQESFRCFVVFHRRLVAMLRIRNKRDNVKQT